MKNKFIVILVAFCLVFSVLLGVVSTSLFTTRSSEELVIFIKIKNSYKIWNAYKMRTTIQEELNNKYGTTDPNLALNRNYSSLYMEWWVHNIGYYMTKPFTFVERINVINLRFKDVDLEKKEDKKNN